MKKLKLKLSGIKEMLSREQMKNVNGGYNWASCSATAECSGHPDVYCEIFGQNALCSAEDELAAICVTDDDQVVSRCP